MRKGSRTSGYHRHSLFEAAVLGLAEFRRCGFAEAMFGLGTKLTVRVREPEMSHVVSVGWLRSWLDGVGKSPGEQVEKNRLKHLLTR